MLNYSVLSNVHFFQAPREIPGLFDSFFRGLFLVKGLPVFFQLGFVLSFAFSILTAVQFTRTQKLVWKRLSISGSFLAFLLAAFLLFQPWDELFIYVRHARNFAETGNFSFNRFEKIDGIVDFLPFFILGLLHRLGLPLLETGFWMQIVAGWFCILAGQRILCCLTKNSPTIWYYPLLALYPPLLLNAGSGFAFLFFTAFILWSLVFLFFNPPNKSGWFTGCFLLSIVPLARLEGTWFCLLLFAFLFLSRKPGLSLRKLFLGLGLTLLPFSALTLWRILNFGNAIPVPVIYKSSIGTVFFTLIGLRNFLMDSFAGGAAFFSSGISLWWIQSNRKIESPEKRVAFQLFWLLLFFSVPYYLSGGDWFPPSLGRYLFPFSFFSFIFFISIALETSVELRKTSVFSLFLFGVLFLATLSFPFGSFTRLSEGLFTHKSSLSAINLKKLGKGNYRIQYLSQLGNHLKATTGPKTVIGSSEIATIMFFAEREALDLLGVTNIEIARSPLRKTPELFSKVKSQNELPHLIFKRLKPELLFEKRPGIFYAFDYILKDLLDNDHPEEISESDLSLALKRWERKFQELNQSLFGGMEALEKHGYDPVLVKHGNGFVSLYFVSRETKEEHFSMMRQAGMAQSVLRNSHL